MTSPIFMLSETLSPILDEMRNDTESLHSCMFVNRTWCRLTAPILWRAPFKDRWLDRSSLITTFIGCLDDASKEKLKLFSNFPSEALKVPTFDYVYFLRELHFSTLYDLVKSWCKEQDLNIYTEGDTYLYPATTILDILVEHFMDKSKYLSILSIPIVTHRKGDYVSLSKHDSAARKCLPNIRYFNCDDWVPENLKFASKFCTNLNRLDIDCSWGNDREVSAFIKAQKHLQHLTVTKRWPNLNDTINIENFSRSIKCVVLKDNKHQMDNGGPLSVLTSCKNLEIMRFYNWLSLPENDMDALVSNYFPRLRKLSFIRCKPTADMIITMILVNGSNLQELTVSWETSKYDDYSVIRAIASNCPNLKYLDAPITRNDLSCFYDMLRSCKKLQNLTINVAKVEEEYDVDHFLPTMGTIIPESLYQLNIFASWKFTAESLREFLMNNCKNCFKCLGFYRSVTDEHLKVITEYANERKSLSYLELRCCEKTSREEIKRAKESISDIAVYNFTGRRMDYL
ncbi:hypothetical protein C1645_182026 [Glomus cerebriforme]|uniref:F-box domain-containing protein n=1 Tax=Glomus cerebriforme TaxID=658196 RepID=A0A397T1D4_9GLOM|nr:hypothetical protein C1645_182026 [Glomus cerebriforme]